MSTTAHDETKHPRDAGGQFRTVPKGEASDAIDIDEGVGSPVTREIERYSYDRSAAYWSAQLSDGGYARGTSPSGSDEVSDVTFYDADKKYHRGNDRPAIVDDNGLQWMRHGKPHRDVGPAVIESDGRVSYWRGGHLVKPGLVSDEDLKRDGVQRTAIRGASNLYYPDTQFDYDINTERGNESLSAPPLREDERFAHHFTDHPELT